MVRATVKPFWAIPGEDTFRGGILLSLCFLKNGLCVIFLTAVPLSLYWNFESKNDVHLSIWAPKVLLDSIS